MRRLLLSLCLTLFSASLACAQVEYHIYLKCPALGGDPTITTPGFDKGEHFRVYGFSFGIEREVSDSGEKGGTEDINIGIGELQECTISKSMDRASAKLAQFAINGNSCGTAEIEFVEVGGGG